MSMVTGMWGFDMMIYVQHLRRIKFFLATIAVSYILSEGASIGVLAETEFCSRYVNVDGYSCTEYQVSECVNEIASSSYTIYSLRF